MFIGHYAPAIAAAAWPRTQRPGLKLGALFVAAQLVDLAFFSFVLLGIEHMRAVPGTTAMNAMDLYDMPYTHSLIGTLAFAGLWAAGTLALGAGRRAAIVGAAVVASHWLLDLLVHAPDLTLAGGKTRYGLALWDRPTIEMPLELAITFGALLLFVRRTRARGWRGTASIVLLAITLLAVQIVNWSEPQPLHVVDPVPPAQPLTALAAYLVLTMLAWWTGRTRPLRAGPAVSTL